MVKKYELIFYRLIISKCENLFPYIRIPNEYFPTKNKKHMSLNDQL